MNGAHVLQADVAFQRFKGRGQPVLFSNVVARCESVRSVQTNAQVKLRTSFNNLPQMLEAMAYTLALPGSVFEKDTESVQAQPFTCNLQAFGARGNRVLLAGASRAAWMHHQII